MHVRSVALATEIELAATRGTIDDRNDYLVVRTPEDPGYYLGNLLVLPAPPQVGEVAYWTRRFTDEFRDTPKVRHVAFRWDGSAGDPGARRELTAAGFTIEDHWVMAAARVTGPSVPFELRPLRPAELPATAELEWTIGDNHAETFRQFLHRRAAWKAKLATSGAGTFWGAFESDGMLVGSLGLVPLGARARYQDVQTRTSHRRRGIASALLAVSAAGVAVDQFVIVAEPESEASRVYTRAGFVVIERMVSAFNAPASR